MSQVPQSGGNSQPKAPQREHELRTQSAVEPYASHARQHHFQGNGHDPRRPLGRNGDRRAIVIGQVVVGGHGIARGSESTSPSRPNGPH